jgi:hypothetical protein
MFNACKHRWPLKYGYSDGIKSTGTITGPAEPRENQEVLPLDLRLEWDVLRDTCAVITDSSFSSPANLYGSLLKLFE